MLDNTKSGVPLGLGMALAQNTRALNRFASLTPEQRQKMINQTHTIESKEEMAQYVQQIADGQIEL